MRVCKRIDCEFPDQFRCTHGRIKTYPNPNDPNLGKHRDFLIKDKKKTHQHTADEPARRPGNSGLGTV
ncbi:hypothetical protein Alches_04160 [Alicyclobacillus hesperidum subsp. aegles]|nr:hypothetical protein Alches_04160 [Alicyclobacillus hesperidum subsp. aegles]